MKSSVHDASLHVGNEGELVLEVPNKRVARLIQLGIHAERTERQRSLRRKMQRLSRRRNRSKN